NQQYAEALHYLEPLVEEVPYNKEYRHAFARALQATGETERATEQFRWLADAELELAKIISLEGRLSAEPNNVELRYELGMIRLRYSSAEEGIKMLLSVLDLQPSHAETRTALADYYRDQGNVQMARRFELDQESHSNQSENSP
ncbi:MAG TPA: hypothetical protein VLA12_21720, partial [Planctomycetaceae bacterium]|nr:hypothetical protein [Planctomycetaceae bacterium]